MASAPETAEWIVDNPYISVLLICLTIIGFCLSIYFYFESRRQKKPCYSIITQQMVPKLGDIFQLFYLGERFNRFSVSYILFWNDGRESIRKEDISSKEPIIISTGNDNKLLEGFISIQKNTANNYSLKRIDDQNISIHFDFIDKNQGAIITLYHTGEINTDTGFKGTIIGGGQFKYKSIPDPQQWQEMHLIALLIYSAVVIFALIKEINWLLFISVFGYVAFVLSRYRLYFSIPRAFRIFINPYKIKPIPDNPSPTSTTLPSRFLKILGEEGVQKIIEEFKMEKLKDKTTEKDEEEVQENDSNNKDHKILPTIK